MRAPYHIPFWKTTPLIRLLLPLMAGIIIQWYARFTISYLLYCLSSFMLAYLLFYFFSASARYYLKKLQGLLFVLLILIAGALLTWQKDGRHHPKWYGHFLTDSSALLVRLQEPLTAKQNSYKADGVVETVLNGNEKHAAQGKVLIYFAKDSSMAPLIYGQLLLVNKPLQIIRNSGNPGAFNYQRYAAFQLLYHQLYLRNSDWVAIGNPRPGAFRSFLFNTRKHIINVLQKYISNEHQQLGIAEALLIGYKEDLDKDLVQAYSNTGVVHIIAISGLHLGLIFFVLLWICNHMPLLKKSRHAKVLVLITCLWLFALLTGGAASVLRSAVMFTVVVLGKYYFRQGSVYNSLAVSAFLLLCYNPYYLWDVGFQLSYLAVAGIVFLQPRIFKMVYIGHPVPRKAWELLSVTLAAQVAAFPICLYYFHQFPNLFLFCNLLVLPLTTIILYCGVLLIVISALPVVATYLGIGLSFLIGLMNRIIHFFNSFSFSVWDGIYANVYTTWLLYGIIFFLLGWWLQRNRTMMRMAIVCLLAFTGLHLYAMVQLVKQQKLVIYNVSKHSAIDFINGSRYRFVGDSVLKEEGLLQNFHLKPARISMQADDLVTDLPGLKNNGNYWQFYKRKILLIDSAMIFEPKPVPISIDVLLVTKNANVRIADLVSAVKPAVIVFDASNNLWKIANWKKECEELLLRCHTVSEKGAFVLDARP